MKKFENLGRNLTKNEQKQIGGGESCCVKTCNDGTTHSLTTCYVENVCDAHQGEKDCVCGNLETVC